MWLSGSYDHKLITCTPARSLSAAGKGRRSGRRDVAGSECRLDAAFAARDVCDHSGEAALPRSGADAAAGPAPEPPRSGDCAAGDAAQLGCCGVPPRPSFACEGVFGVRDGDGEVNVFTFRLGLPPVVHWLTWLASRSEHKVSCELLSSGCTWTIITVLP
mmetsp:Transcript_86677/g.242830  ORF Transcript_86677/g.242830 Transcript_86677/m.242830 type:complete len:160 (-) Transcript_86677:643-1122(-)